MKRLSDFKKNFIYRLFRITICNILIALTFSSCSVETSKKGEYLLSTQWDQVNMYAKSCPDNNRAGCWSTAIAQILYFHRMIPTGKVDYKTTTGYKLSEDLDSYKFYWDLFTEKLDDRTSKESIDQVAKYIYYTSLVLEKDFNTDSYKTVISEYKDGASAWNVDNVIKNLNNHFNCKVKDYHYTKEELKTYVNDIEKLIKKEIDSNRPIMLYMQLGNTGHSTVIDGYSYIDDKFIVHINLGFGGNGNEWYDFNKPIADELDDMNHRILLTIKPSINNTKNVTETLNKTNYLLETQWDKAGNYSKFCPQNKAIGYWSTALAQVLAYHKYQPTGGINYESSSGLKINENLDFYKFNWDLFVERLDAKASEQSIDQIAKYNYYTEVVLEKNFGSNGYKTIIDDKSNIDVSKIICNLNKYFKCNAKAHRYMEEEIKLSKDAIVALIKTEIDKKCPLLLYYKAYSGEGYSVVIDGYAEENNKFFTHINTGMDGYNNQWYELFGPMVDMKCLILITIE